jgi:hypothetical protein
MLRTLGHLALPLAALALIAVVGCQDAKESSPQTKNEKQEVKPPSPGKDGEHGHKAGGHGGNIVEIGRDNYHAEAVFEKDGVVRLYLLGKDEARVQEVESQTLRAYARPPEGVSAPFELRPAPSRDDGKGKTSRFVGTLPRELWGKPVEVTVPTIRIAGERFRFSFQSAAPPAHAAMPAAVPGAKAKQLYLTPKGKYTEADIDANGRITARQKYGDEMSEHDAKPKKGDRICPVSKTKANPKFRWVVGGKAYTFCCPPCIDEFVKWAKETPDKVELPEAYVQR